MGGVAKAFNKIHNFVKKVSLGARLFDKLMEGMMDEPDAPVSTENTQEGSKAYQIGFKQNVAALGDPIPVLYGTLRYYPPLAAQFYQVYENNYQYLYGLLCLGQGHIEVLQAWIGESNIADLSDVEYQVYKPADHGGVVGNINAWSNMREHVYTSAEGTVRTDAHDAITYGPYIVCPVGLLLSAIEIDLNFSSGIGLLQDNGNVNAISLTFTATLQAIDDAGNDIGSPEVVQTTFNEATRDELLRTWNIPTATNNRYKISLTRTTAASNWKRLDDCDITGLKGVIYYPPATPAYGNTSIMAVRVKATASVGEGSRNKISVQAQSLIPTVDAPMTHSATSNPADIFADILTNQIYGGRLLEKHITRSDLVSHQTNWAGENGFNALFDSKGTIAEAIEACLLPVRAKPVIEGIVFNVVQDGPKAAKWLFSPSNILPDSLTVTYRFSTEKDTDGYEVQYRPALGTDPAYVVYPAESTVPKRANLFGCTDEATARNYARLLWQQQLYGRKAVSFTVEMEGHLPRPGDVAHVTHYVIAAWGEDAELVKVQGDVLTIDKPIDWLMSDKWEVDLRGEDGVSTGMIELEPVDQYSFKLLSDPGIALWTTTSEQAATICIFSGYQTEQSYFQIVEATPIDSRQVNIRGAVYDERIWEDTLGLKSWTTLKEPLIQTAQVDQDGLQ